MGKYTIISDGKKVNMFDKELGVNLSLKNYILNYHFSSIVNKVGLFVTADDSVAVSELENYFEKIPLLGFKGPIIFIQISKNFISTDDIAKYIYHIEERDNILKAIYYDDYLYISDGIVNKINKGFHFAEIKYKEIFDLKNFFPYLIKIIEGLIIENHLKLGFFPIHSSLIGCEDDECILIMGNSQSGKTTTARLFCNTGKYKMLSDDIAFIDSTGLAYPYGQYIKIINNNKTGIFNEQITYDNLTIYREIYKISNLYKPYKIKCIILPQIMFINKSECFRLSEKDIGKISIPLLSEYPNKWFVYSEYNFILGYQVMCLLEKIPFYQINLKFQSDNKEITKLWEDQCITL